MNRWTLLSVLGVLLMGAPSWAADGDSCGSDNFQAVRVGPMKPSWCVLLCDDDTSASGSCADFSFAGSTVGVADAISFEVGTDNDCSAGTVTLETHWVSSGQHHEIGSTNTLDLSGSGTTRIVVDGRTAPLAAIVSTDFSGVSGCTGGFDVLMIGYEEKR